MQLQNVENIYPLSPLQEGMLFHSVSEPESGMYVNQSLMTLRGALDVAIFRRAWQQVLRQHAILRTFFVWDGVKAPVQVVQKSAELPVSHIDVRGMSPQAQQQKIAAAKREDLGQGFHLTKAPLLRCILLQTADDSHEFLWSFHHILMDGWSMFRVLQDFFASYDTLASGQSVTLQSVPPYRNYIAWLKQRDMAKTEQYWRKKLAGFSKPTPLVIAKPAVKDAPAMAEFATEKRYLPSETSRAIEAFCQQHHLTVNTVAQAAWALALGRYSDDDDVVFGAIVSGRPPSLPGAENMVGLFINALPVRMHMPAETPVLDWLHTQQTLLAEMREYEYSPLQKVQEWSDIERGQSLFDSIFMFENYRKDTPLEQMGGVLQVSNDRWFERINYPLAALVEPGEKMLLRFVYQTDRFEADDLQRMLGHWQILLENIIAETAARLSSLAMLSAGEQQQILHDWNATEQSFPLHLRPYDFFTEQVAANPDRIAVSCGDESVTYRELDLRANQLANYLQKQGVGPEVLVGICLGRSIELVLGILGVIKAGGAYVPIDPAYPGERIRYVLDDANAPLLLTTAAVASVQSSVLSEGAGERWSGGAGEQGSEFNSHQQPTANSQQPSAKGQQPTTNSQVILLDRDWPQIAQCSEAPPPNHALAENPAYVIYTSGSTGKPKGVVIPNSGLTNLICWHNRVYDITAGDRATLVATPAFDASVWELWPYLAIGASVHIPHEDTIALPSKLLDWLAENAVTISFLPTPLAEAVLQEPLPAHLSLRAMLVGGDKLRRTPPATLPFELVNNYGPTENTVVATWTPVKTGVELIAAPPIGRPVDNAQAYILDKNFWPTPVGIAAELCIAGSSLARGYLNRPDLTAERFVPCVWKFETGNLKLETGNWKLDTGSRGSNNEHRMSNAEFRTPDTENRKLNTDHRTPTTENRMYRTGDLARYLENGQIEFLGRIDFQVKIRGHRIELGEIDTALMGHAAVREAVTIAWEDGATKKHLVAYVVLKQSSPSATDELRGYLKESLPDYMVPSLFVVLDALPLTPNGKLDRKALPSPQAARSEQHDDFVAPRNDIEKQLAKVWAEVLKVERVGVHDNFFELGGDSILSIQIISKAGQVGLRLTPKQIFTNPTVAELALECTPTNGADTEPAAEDLTGSFALSPIQSWFFEQEFIAPSHWNMAMLLEIEQQLRPEQLRQVIAALMAQHDALGLRFQKNDARWQQHFASYDEVPFASEDLTALDETAQQQKFTDAAQSAQRSLDLHNGPLLRVVHFALGKNQPDRLLFVIHHLAVDAVSWRILLEDLQTACGQIVSGESIQLPAKTTSFKKWLAHLQAFANSETLEKGRDFWTNTTELQPLPVDRQGENIAASRRTVEVALSSEKTRALLQDVPKAYKTQINDVLLTAFAQTIARWTGQSSVLLALEGHGREELPGIENVDLSRTVGWFTTMFPLKLQLAVSVNPGELLKSTKEQLRQIPNRGIGYGLLRYLCDDAEVADKLAAQPWPQVSFNYLGHFGGQTDEQASIRVLDAPTGDANDAAEKRNYLLEITGRVADGILKMEWAYSENCHQRETIDKLAQAFMSALSALIEHCLSPEAGGFTPSDFPLANLNSAQLDKLLKKKVAKAG